MHDRDLSGWAAEGDEAEFEPEPKSLPKRDAPGFNLASFVCSRRGYVFVLYS
jgi:hypothetical protein